MSDVKLAQKLQLKGDQSLLILNVPTAVLDHITASLPTISLSTETTTPCDGVLLFAQNSQDLARWAKTAVGALKADGLFWIAYPKKSSNLETDLTRDVGWQLIKQMGWEGVRQIAIDSNWSALRFKPSQSDADLIAAQYSGKKADLRPIYDKIMTAAVNLGEDVTINVRKGYVAFHRSKQFALINPSTQTRLDLALKLQHPPQSERLIAESKVGSGSMTHVVPLTELDQVDEEVVAWLRLAYDQAGS